jgi:hypothetical protein
MPITDNDLVTVRKATRTGATNISFEVHWKEGTTGEDKGTYTLSWADTDAFREFLQSQTFEDAMRAVLLQCLNTSTGALRGAVFDSLPGKTFRIMQRCTLES